jgi:hypothetical protein
MSRRGSSRGGRGREGRWVTYAWIAGLAAVTTGLIYYQQTALLYILATLGVTALLVVVAAADLGGGRKGSGEIVADDAAAIGAGITPVPAVTATSPRPARPAKRK